MFHHCYVELKKIKLKDCINPLVPDVHKMVTHNSTANTAELVCVTILWTSDSKGITTSHHLCSQVLFSVTV